MQQKLMRKLLTAVAVTAIAAGLAATATAQEQQAGKLDVVVVTAQQRAENLQDVPLSAAQMSQDELQTIFTGGDDSLALSSRVPGVYAESSNGRAAPRFYIRGLGNIDFDLAASQPVSIIQDDVIMENVALKSTPVFDLDQVEVYRGPQGTLFGRNTTAGIIRFISKRPTETSGYDFNASYGTYGTTSLEGGIGGAIMPGLSVRASGLWQHREDYIDDTNRPGKDDLGGFDETAGRLQVLYAPDDKLKMLFNVHGRDLDGTSAIFRANVITKGSDGLNGNYHRRSVSYSGGNNDNHQEYQGWGSSANITYDFGGATFTSITAYESTSGQSRGDIDGGKAGVGPGFIPFDADSEDRINALEQFTQEVRLASDTSQKLTWQVGAYYFDSSVDISSFGSIGTPPLVTLTHENQSWAVFGQGSYQFTDQFKVVAGLRYTDDDKDLTVKNVPAFNRSVSDDHVSWELSGLYELTPNVNVYARVADGFRGPSIQARDAGFGGAPSVATSETNLSWEAGWKETLLDNTLRLNGAVYTYTVSDIQLTAVGGSGNLIHLINADKGKAYGAEIDAEWTPTENLVFTGGVAYTHTELDDSTLGVGVCAQCTVTDPTVVRSGTTLALIDGNPFPNAPELTANFTARYSVPVGAGGEIFGFTDWAYQGKTNIFLYESKEFETDHQFEGGLKIGYARTDGSWEVAAFARNITDEDNIKGAIDFNNNTAFVNEPRIIGVSFTMHH